MMLLLTPTKASTAIQCNIPLGTATVGCDGLTWEQVRPGLAILTGKGKALLDHKLLVEEPKKLRSELPTGRVVLAGLALGATLTQRWSAFTPAQGVAMKGYPPEFKIGYDERQWENLAEILALAE